MVPPSFSFPANGWEELDSAANGCLRGRLLLFRLLRKRFGAQLPGGVHGCQAGALSALPGEGRSLSVDLRFAATRPGRRLCVSSAGAAWASSLVFPDMVGGTSARGGPALGGGLALSYPLNNSSSSLRPAPVFRNFSLCCASFLSLYRST